MSLEKALAGLTASNDVTPTDVAMKMLDPADAIMHTEIKNVGVMNALGVTADYCDATGDKLSGEVLRRIYNLNVLHMVSYKRKREGAIVKMFASLMAMFNQNGQQEKRGGLFGNGQR